MRKIDTSGASAFKCPITRKNKLRFDTIAEWVRENCEGYWIDEGSLGFWPGIRLYREKDYVAFLLKWSD